MFAHAHFHQIFQFAAHPFKICSSFLVIVSELLHYHRISSSSKIRDRKDIVLTDCCSQKSELNFTPPNFSTCCCCLRVHQKISEKIMNFRAAVYTQKKIRPLCTYAFFNSPNFLRAPVFTHEIFPKQMVHV